MNAKKIALVFCAVAAVVAVAGGYLFWGVPGELSGMKAEDWRNLIFLVGGLTAAMIAAWRAQVADKQIQINEQSQITERFTRAVDQLGSENIYMRIGALHALERIGRDSENDVVAILRLLANFIRHKSPANNNAGTLPSDAKECLGVVGRLSCNYKKFLNGDNTFHLDLSASNLMPFPLVIEGCFRNFNFSDSNIMRGYFAQHDFSGASFFGANLTDAFFWECNFRRASFMFAILDSARFYDTDMSEVTLHMATCNNTNFSTAKNLTTEMLKNIIYDAETPPKIPEGVDLPSPR